MREADDIDWGFMDADDPSEEPLVDDRDVAPKFDRSASQEVMRGDLEQMPLPDIFQALSVASLEGVLTLSSPRQERYLYFRGGTVRDLVFGRPTHQRLGERLMAAGLITEDHLRVALMEQTTVQRPLGEVLVNRGVLDQRQLEGVADYQACEDLHALFTWKRGAFEFYKGKPDDPRLLSRLEVVPEFQVEAILLEAARRRDEWVSLLESIQSVDEILRPIPGCDTGGLDFQHSAVMAVIDGERSIQELSERSLLGLFDCARACKNLVNWRMAERLGAEDLLSTAERMYDRGETKSAIVALRTLFDRGSDELGLDLTKRLAFAMQRCGDSRLGARCLWRVAEDPANRAVCLDLLREACEIDTRSSYLLRALQQCLRREGAPEHQVTEVTIKLVNTLAAEGQDDEALAEFAWLEAHGGDPVKVLGRKVRILQKLGRSEQVIEALEQLAEVFRASKRFGALAKVYEQILKQDARRKDIAKALIELSSNKRLRQLRHAAVAAVVVAFCIGGYAYYRHSDEAERIEQAISRITAMVDAGRLEGVESLITSSVAEFGPLPELGELRERLHRHRNLSAEKFAREREQLAQPQLERARDHLTHGELGEALAIYEELLLEKRGRELVLAKVQKDVGDAAFRLTKAATQLPGHVPGPPTELQTAEEHQQALDDIAQHFAPELQRLAEEATRAAGRDLLTLLLGKEGREGMIANAAAVSDLFATVEKRAREHRKAQEELRAKERLQGVFEAARQHEARFEFEEALRDYERLIAEFPNQGALIADFKAKADLYREIVARQQELRAATERGDYRGALRELEQLCTAHPEFPLRKLTRLPLRLESTPPGAAVLINDEVVEGRTPLLTSYVAEASPTVELRLEGFLPKKFLLPKEAEGRAAAILSKAPNWANVAPGSVQRQPVCDGQGSVFLVDRSGTITRLALENGNQIWKQTTPDLSGHLTRPVLAGPNVVAGSFDGPLRAYDRQSARKVWQTDGLPCEGAPALVGAILMVATVDGELVGVRPESGQELYRQKLPGPVHANVVESNGHAFLVTRDGHVVCVSPNGKIVWDKKLASSFIANPAVGSDVVIVASDDGSIHALAAADGDEIWKRSGLGELTLRPAIVGERVVVAGPNDLYSFALANGKSGPRYKSQHPWSSAPVFAGGKLVVGNQVGVVFVLDPETLRPLYIIRGTGTISAPLGFDPSGGVIAAFEDKVVLGFRELP